MRRYNPAMTKLKNIDTYSSTECCTYKGVFNKVVIFFIFTLLGAFSSIALLAYNPAMLYTGLTIGSIVTLISGFCALCSVKMAKTAGMIYSFAEGFTIGFFALIFEAVASGVVLAALVSTLAVVLVVATVYFSGIIKVNGTFMKFLLTISISFILAQLILGLLSLFGVFAYTPQISMGVSIIMIIIASMYLMFDLNNIKQAVEMGAHKQYEWFCAFGLVYTVLWIFMELLPLLASLIQDN